MIGTDKPAVRDWFQEIADSAVAAGCQVGNVPHVPSDEFAIGPMHDLMTIVANLARSIRRRDLAGVAFDLAQVAVHANRIAGIWGIDLRETQAFVTDRVQPWLHAEAESNGGQATVPDDLMDELRSILAKQQPIAIASAPEPAR